MQNGKVFLTFVVVMICVLTVWAARRVWPGRAKFDRAPSAASRSQGPPSAPYRVVEYMDYECRHCRNLAALLLDVFEKNYPDVYLEVRFRPFKGHPRGMRAAVYADCAARQGRFWMLHPILLEKQDEWLSGADAEALFRGYSRMVRSDEARFDACVESEETEKGILAEKGRAESIGVRSTPTVFVNEKMAVGEAAVRDLLAYSFPEKKAEAKP
ncbi:MAG: thioredoxin domain-containing protein [Candidatus Omnitrophica bacterium]|nr:thioredoxin domain-containing protein [Candidatus Omnitrophota bacterium]